MTQPHAEKATILAVDDTPENLDIIKGILVPQYRVLSAISGEAALKLIQKTLPDLILLDIMMPGMSGYEVCRKIKENPATRHVPIIFVTALDKEQDELQGLALGAVDYVRKPLSLPVLKARVAVHVALKRAQMALQEKNRLLEEERTLVEKVVQKMRSDPYFDPRHLRYWMEPLERTSGDILLSAFRPDGSQHVLLGDFTGHGLQAAVGGPLVAAYFYLRTLDGLPGWALLKELNQNLSRQLPTGTFMAAAFVEISPQRDRFRLWNAALPEQLLFLEPGSTPHPFLSSLPALGLLKNLSIQEEAWIDWTPESRLYLYSDGLVEPENEQGEPFGLDRLITLLSHTGHDNNANNVMETIQTIRQYGEKGRQADDMSMVELRAS